LEGLVTAVSKPLFGGVYEGRRVLVTGHTGFKGSWLTRWLLDLGAHVTGYALEPPTDPALFDELDLAARIDHNIGDVRDLAHLRDVMAAAKPEIVLHLAAQPLVRLSYDEPVSTFETNVMGSVNVLEAARSVGSVRVVLNVTSDKCYENREWEFAYRENDAMGGYDPYSASKGCAELVTAAYRRSFFGDADSASVATARAGNVIGGGDWALDRIVPDCVRALAAGEPIVVRNPDAVRPWQHVLEPTSGYLWLASRLFAGTHDYDGAWNFGPAASGNITVREVVETVLAEWGSGEWVGPEAGTRNPHEAHFLKLDCSKATDLLAWRGVWDAQQALRYTTSWYREYYADPSIAEKITTECVSAYVTRATELGAAWAR
jgi:CDP-glucose 4,6-dehydratase